jgi:outer membrane biosynthesis protein TonB
MEALLLGAAGLMLVGGAIAMVGVPMKWKSPDGKALAAAKPDSRPAAAEKTAAEKGPSPPAIPPAKEPPPENPKETPKPKKAATASPPKAADKPGKTAKPPQAKSKSTSKVAKKSIPPPTSPRASAREADSVVREISPKSKRGLSLGAIKAGTVLRLQYVSGKWKAWGKLPSACPDDPNEHDPGDHNRLAIVSAPASGPVETLAVVPTETAAKPFEFTVPRDLENVALRISGGHGDWAKNPDGHVQYRVTVLSPKAPGHGGRGGRGRKD